MPNFIEIGQTSLEKSVNFSVLPDIFFCHGQKRDYMSRVSQRVRDATKKAEPFWILMKLEVMGWQWHQLDHMQIILTSLQTDNHTQSIFLWAGYSFYHPTNDVKALKVFSSRRLFPVTVKTAVMM